MGVVVVLVVAWSNLSNCVNSSPLLDVPCRVLCALSRCPVVVTWQYRPVLVGRGVVLVVRFFVENACVDSSPIVVTTIVYGSGGHRSGTSRMSRMPKRTFAFGAQGEGTRGNDFVQHAVIDHAVRNYSS